MQAALRDRYGPPDVVSVVEVPRPVPAPGQVLVRVHAASVNRADLDNLYPRWAFMRSFLGVRRPRNKRLGSDVAGVVEAVGPSATRFMPGDRVFGDLFSTGLGAFAEYVAAPERSLALMPAGMSFDDAATLPHSAILAIQGLRRRDGRTPGPSDKVMVVGASGNVGPFAVQIAKWLGAEVTGVCRAEKFDFVASLGADHLVDYTTVDPTRTGEQFDWILDVDAHQSIFRWRGALRPHGSYITLGGPASVLLTAGIIGPIISRFGTRYTGMMFWWKPFLTADLETLTSLIASGRLTPQIDRRFPLSKTADALRWVDDGRARGKVVITA